MFSKASQWAGMADQDLGRRVYPRRGQKAAIVSLAVIGFIRMMVLLFLCLRLEPDQQHETQPDRPQSSAIVRTCSTADA